MADDDDGWGGTVDEPAWGGQVPNQPPGQPPSPGGYPPPVPPTQAGYPPPVAPTQAGYPGYSAPAGGYGANGLPPAWSGPPAPGGASPNRNRNLILAIIGVAVVVAAVLVGVSLSSGGGGKHNAVKTTPPPSTSGSSTSNSDTPSPSPSASPSSGSTLLSQAAFTSCQNEPTADYVSKDVLSQIACTGTDVQSAVSADEVGYVKFTGSAGLQSWYQSEVITANNVTAGAGNCAAGTLVTTTNGANYCEGAFTDDTGAQAEEFLAVAPSTVALGDGGPNSTADACGAGTTYTVLIFTSPSDDVGGLVLSCSGSTTLAGTFQQHLSAGDFDLND